MVLSFELSDYLMLQIKPVPDNVACKSRAREWGVPWDSVKEKTEPAMNISIQKQASSRGGGMYLKQSEN